MKKQKKSKIEEAKACNKRSFKRNFVARTNVSQANGITLIALVISIIVMLILAGVSINAIVGENGVLTKAQTATFAQKIATYKEELEMNIVGNAKDMLPNRESVTRLNDSVKEYIPSLKDDDVSKFGIIAGELYYLWDNPIEKEACKNQNLKVKTEEQSVEEFVAFIENNALETIIKNMAGASFTEIDKDGNEKELGVKLSNKSFSNPNWKLISTVENNVVISTYGDDWYYVEAGNNIDGIGPLSSSYIINYKTGKAVKFNVNTMTMLSATSNLGIKDGLILNIDSSILDSVDNTDDMITNPKKYFGEDVSLYNVDKNFIGNYELHFDGVDDFMTIDSKGVDLSSLEETGFSFEYYGKVNRGIAYRKDNYEENYNDYDGCILSTYDTLDGSNIWNHYQNIRVKITPERKIVFSCGNPYMGKSDFSNTVGFLNNQYYSSIIDDVVYIQVSYNPNETYIKDDVEYITQYFYLNGVLEKKGGFRKDVWESFIEQNKGAFLWEIGRGNGADYGGVQMYSKLDCRAMRLYNKAFSENDASVNYNATVAYYEYITNTSAGENQNTGGDDIGNIK